MSSGKLQNLIDRWLLYLRMERGFSPHTIHGYRCDVDQAVRYIGAQLGREMQLGDLTRPVLQDWLNSQSVGASTKHHKRSALLSFCGYLVEEGIRPDNPAAPLRCPRLPRRTPLFLSETDALRLMAAPLQGGGRPTVWQLQDAAVLHLLYGGGMRAGEAGQGGIGDAVRHLTLRTLVRDVPEPGDLSVRVVGKGNRDRVVILPRQAREVLQRFLGRRHEIPGSQDTDVLFLSGRRLGIVKESGPRPLTRRGVLGTVKRYAVPLGIYAYPHMLRHSYAVHIRQQEGSELDALQEQMGHLHLDTTRRYAQVDLRWQKKHCTALHPLDRPPPAASQAPAQQPVQLSLRIEVEERPDQEPAGVVN